MSDVSATREGVGVGAALEDPYGAVPRRLLFATLTSLYTTPIVAAVYRHYWCPVFCRMSTTVREVTLGYSFRGNHRHHAVAEEVEALMAINCVLAVESLDPTR